MRFLFLFLEVPHICLPHVWSGEIANSQESERSFCRSEKYHSDNLRLPSIIITVLSV